MSTHSAPSATSVKNQIDVQSLWAKYEDVAMHFNDLLMRLRTQGLAGIAAIATIVGLFTKSEVVDPQTDWLVAGCIFSALAAFWIAIACIDLLYYNRLLLGAVAALVQLEKRSASGESLSINMSTEIVAEFTRGWLGDGSSYRGVYTFYGLVFLVVLGGAMFSFHMYCSSAI